jgi:hydrogenase-4 component B
MDSIHLLICSILLNCLGAIIAILLSWNKRAARFATCIFCLFASLVGIASAVMALFASSPPVLSLFKVQLFGALELRMDGLSAFLVGLIGLVGIATSVYSFSSETSNGVIGFFVNLFMAAMVLVVTASNAFYFLVFWELMTLVSYFLVIWETRKKESIITGYIYLVVAHAGAALIMFTFLMMFQKSGSFDFTAIRQTSLTPGIRNLVFFLAFLGFGAKAGMVPFHFWTPATYAAAPNQVSALMAGVMKKTAVYGILRVCIDLLGFPLMWWGFVVLAFGIASTVFGAFYALTERNIKRLLAYSSVENVGIILAGVGVSMVGMASQQSILVVLGLLAALYHMLNHAFFKGLLFLGAGSAISQACTQDLNRMGGLGRRMPWTALAFLIGALAVSAVPPFNGFISEWFTYQALFKASTIQVFASRVLMPLFAVLLALAGALAVMVYIKAYGSIFTGPARSEEAAAAKEAGVGKLISMLYLALGCLVLGLGAPFIAPQIVNIVVSFSGVTAVIVSNGWQIFPGDSTQGILSPPLIAILLLGLLTVPVLLIALFRGYRAGFRKDVEPWACGYGYKPQMSISASSFDQPVKVSFWPVYWMRTLVDRPFRAIKGYSQSVVRLILDAEPVVESLVTRPAMHLVERAGQWIQFLQMGDIRVYCMYIVLTLVILLIVIFGRSGL